MFICIQIKFKCILKHEMLNAPITSNNYTISIIKTMKKNLLAAFPASTRVQMIKKFSLTCTVWFLVMMDIFSIWCKMLVMVYPRRLIISFFILLCTALETISTNIFYRYEKIILMFQKVIPSIFCEFLKQWRII